MIRRVIPTALAAIMIVSMILPLSAAAAPAAQGPETTPGVIFRGVSTAVKFDVSPPLRDIAPLVAPESKPREIPELATGLEGAQGPQTPDAVVQSWTGTGEIPAPIISFDGPNNISSVSPPDPNGDVGPNHVVVMSNLSFQIFNKSGASLYGPAFNNTLWSGFGGPCQTENAGDPVVLYDQLDDRWMLSQFTAAGPTYYNCVAISQTPDPTGAYYRYAFSTGSNFPDYPKYGWWSDALYISTREFAGGSTFAGVGAYAVNRSQLIAGNPAPTVISFLAAPGAAAYNVGDGLLPADLDGMTLPPAGSPEYFMGSMDNGASYGAPQDALTLWKFTANFASPGSSSFVLANTLPIASIDTVPAFCSGRACIPQPSTTNKLDHLGYRQRPLHRLAYRNFGTHESLVTNQSVEASTTMSGIRWWEIRSPNSSPVVYQDSTYAPGLTDGIWRWMGSIAQDSAGNMALGYSVSDATSTYPGVRYTGRLSTDPLNTMPQGEGTIVTGTGSQTGSNRWGDYTSMSVDPVDDCTFWYVNQWVPTTSSVGWRLRIGAFKFNECGTADFTIAATPASQEICVGAPASYNINIGSISGYNSPVTLSASGNPGTAGFSTNPVTPPGSSTMTISGAGAGTYNFNVVGTAAGPNVHQAPVGLTVQAAAPGAPVLTAPANGALNVAATPTFTWNAVAGASSYSIQVATDSNFTNVVASASGLANPTWTSNVTLNTSTMYYWRVWAANACGTGAYSSVFSFTTVAAPGDCGPGTTANILFQDGFEAGIGGWVSSGTGSTWAIATNNPHSGAQHVHANDPAAVSDQRLASPAVALPSGQNPVVLKFWHVPNMENSGTTACYDGGILEVSSDAGTTWTQVPNANLLVGSYTGLISSSFSNPLGGLQGWCNGTSYTNVVADISSYAGQTVQFRYRLGSDTSVSDTGWDVDDVTVQSCQPAVVDPNIDVSPLSMSATQATNTSTQQTLTVANTGGGTLNWQIAEDNNPAPPLRPMPAVVPAAAPASEQVDAAAPAAPAQPDKALATWQRPEIVLYDNGPLVTHPGGGAGGADASAVQTDLGMSTNGFGLQFTAGNRLADDFTISDPAGWTIDTVTFFLYQTGSTTTSPITAVNLQIWNGPPDQPTSSVVFGDTTTNRLASTSWANMYRVPITGLTGTTRPIMANVVTVGAHLPAGTYWLDWQADGDAGLTGPWNPPVTILGQTSTGNALQYTGSWAPIADVGTATPQGLPFIVNGIVGYPPACVNPNDIPWLSLGQSSGSNTGGTNTPLQVTFNSTGLPNGVYTGSLCVTSDDPTPGPGNGTNLVIVPVTLTVQTPTAVTLSGLATSASPSAIPASLPMAALPAAAGLAMAAVYALRRRR